MNAIVHDVLMRKSYAKYLASLLLFGSNGIVVSGISLPSHEIALVRTVLGALLLFACLAIGGKRLSLHRSRRDFLFVAASGFALGISWIFVYMAYRAIGVAVSSLLYALGPVFLIALSPLLFGSKVTGKMTVGLAVVLFGIVLVNGGLNAASSNVEGVAYGLAAAGCYAAMVAFSKKADAACGLERSAVQLASAAVAVLAAIVVLGMPLEMPASSDILPALVLGLVNTGVGCYLYFSVIAELPTGTVAACSYLEPLSAVMLSAAVLNEPLGAGQWIGGALVIAGALFCELSGRMKPLRLRLPVQSAHMPKHEAFLHARRVVR